MDNLRDEKILASLSFSLITGWVMLAFMVIPITLIHEFLHIVGTQILGGTVNEVVFLDMEAWIGNFIFPFDINTFGYVASAFPEGTNTLLFYILPYMVLFPLGLGMAILSFIDDTFDFLMLVAGPILWSQYIFFWTDFSLALGLKEIISPPLVLNVVLFMIAMSMVSYKTYMMLDREFNLKMVEKLPGKYK